jgi:hypothetical protein
VYAIGLREVQQMFSGRADEFQHEFMAVSEELREVGIKLLEERGEKADALRRKQNALRQRQEELAQTVNQWRDRARAVIQQRSVEGLRDFLTKMLPEVDPSMRAKLKKVIELIDTPQEELEKLDRMQMQPLAQTAAGRLIERARTSYDLRSSDAAERRRAAVEFANRPGMALNDEIVNEIEGALSDPDPLVREVALMTTIQLHRFRALRVADLSIAHESVKRLANIQDSMAIPALIEIAQKLRTGFIPGEGGMIEAINTRSRMVALLRLVEWHTREAHDVIGKLRFDQDKQISDAAKRALELFPDEWSGPLKPPKSK